MNKLIVFRIIITFSLLVFFFGGVNWEIPKTQAAAINSCRSLSTAGSYELTADVTSSGTCFNVGGSGVILDLRGHTVTYATGGSGYGAYIQGSNQRITNGKMIDRGGGRTFAVYSEASNNLEIDNLEMTVQGSVTNTIKVEGGGGYLKIHDNKIQSNMDKIFEHSGATSIIQIQLRGGSMDIYNNTLRGDGQVGIQVCNCPLSADEDIKIHHNDISHATGTYDDGGVSIASDAVQHGHMCDHFEIYNNYIHQVGADGIFVAGWDSTFQQGPRYGKIHHNWIETNPHCYPEASGGSCNSISYGLFTRFGASDIEFYNNVLIGHAGDNVDGQGRGGKYLGVGLICSSPYCQGNTFHDNYVLALTNSDNPDQWAAAIHPTYEDPKFGVSGLKTIKNNTFISNSYLYKVGFWLGSHGYNFLVDNNRLIKASDAKSYFKTIWASNWIGDATKNNWIDNNYLGGAAVDDVKWVEDGPKEFYMRWRYNLTLKNKAGAAISGAIVKISDKSGKQVYTGTTNSQGKLDPVPELMQYSFIGTGTSVAKVAYTPHNINITASGYSNKTVSNFTMDTPKEVTFVLDDTTQPPIISDVAVVNNPIDKTATFTWKTDQSVESSIDYGTSTSYGTSKSGGTGTSHSVTLTNLADNTYHFRAKTGSNTGIDRQFDIFTAGLAGGTGRVTLIKSVNKTTAKSGDALTYTISYTVAGQNVTNAKIEDPIPAGSTYVAGSAKLNGISKTDVQDSDEFSFSGTMATWNLGTLNANTSGNVSFQVRIN